MEGGLKMARHQLEVIVKQIQNVLDTKQVVSAGPFLYVIIQEGTPNCHYLSRYGALLYPCSYSSSYSPDPPL